MDTARQGVTPCSAICNGVKIRPARCLRWMKYKGCELDTQDRTSGLERSAVAGELGQRLEGVHYEPLAHDPELIGRHRHVRE